MKSLLSGIFAFSLLFMMSCEPEEIQSGDASQTASATKSNVVNSVKSGLTALDSIAMAANIQEIAYSNGSYTVSFYDGTGDYTVDVNSFDDSTFIDYTMTSSGGTASEVTIDVLNEEIDIEGVGNYTFTQYENYVISPTENDLKNLMVAITVHHASDPNTSALFTDNGGGDIYDAQKEVEMTGSKFWGKKVVTHDCLFFSQEVCTTIYRFWQEVSTECESEPCQ